MCPNQEGLTPARPDAPAEREPRIHQTRRELAELAERTEELQDRVRDLCVGYSDLVEHFLGEGPADLPDLERSEAMARAGNLGELEAQAARIKEALGNLEELADYGIQVQQRVYDELMPEL